MNQNDLRWDRDFAGEDSAHDLVKDAWERGVSFEHYADLLVVHYRQAHAGSAPDGLRERVLAALTREAAMLGAEAPPSADALNLGSGAGHHGRTDHAHDEEAASPVDPTTRGATVLP